jgi:hypothetical protein
MMASRRIARSSSASVGLAERILKFSVTTSPSNGAHQPRPKAVGCMPWFDPVKPAPPRFNGAMNFIALEFGLNGRTAN